jgi:hypothetical protein
MDSRLPVDGMIEVDDLNLTAGLDRRSADDEPVIPWSQRTSASCNR